MSLIHVLGQPVVGQRPMATPSYTTTLTPSSASLSSATATCLQKPKRLLSGSKDYVATAISPTGVVVAAFQKQIFIYKVNGKDKTQEIRHKPAFSPTLNRKESIRAIAASEDLLVVATHYRLLVYSEYSETNDLANHLIHDQRLNVESNWASWSVSISQKGTSAQGIGSKARVVVGGVGENGVKVFHYVIIGNCWNVVKYQLYLECTNNNEAVKVVGFSPDRSNARLGTMIFALTSGNHLYCWQISRSRRTTGLEPMRPVWDLDCNPSSKESTRVFQDEISSAAMIVCKWGHPYIMCTVDHHERSYLPPTFIVAVDPEDTNAQRRERINPLRDKVVSPSVLAGSVSPNGLFAVVVEKKESKDNIKLLTLQKAPGGALTCFARPQTWGSKLKSINVSSSAISIFMEEQLGALEITIVDGKGHISFARVSVPNMRAFEPSIISSLDSIRELHNEPLAHELSPHGSHRNSVTSGTTGRFSERTSMASS